MSAGAWAAYRSRIAGRTSPTRSRKSPEIKPFCGHRSTYSRQAHCIKDRVLLDPAAGSGNFLTESYLCLRRLENEVIDLLQHGQIVIGAAFNPIKVSIAQFYGIEINDFAVTVAKTALWIAESQMLKRTEDIVHLQLDFLPLKSYVNIIEGNALRIDWNDVIPARELSYIMGNPPFVGLALRSPAQQADMSLVFSDNDRAGRLDYVAAWYKKAAQFINGTKIEVAFVSTNSIVQGEQVPILWKDMFYNEHIIINFAYRPFKWNSEAVDMATVHCVIISFSKNERNQRIIYENGTKSIVKRINGYLVDADNVFINLRGKPQTGYPKLTQGSKPWDGGYLILSEADRNTLIAKYPDAVRFIRLYLGADELLYNKKRYCLWLKDIEPSAYRKIPEIMERLKAVSEIRMKTKTVAVQKQADTPMLFSQIRQPDTDYLCVPEITSENRRYIPIGFLSKDIIASNRVMTMANATVYLFGVMMSNVHMAWTRAICGRLEMRYCYSPSIYNNFPWPTPTDAQKQRIEQTAQAILDARAKFPNSSLADLYDDLTMPPELRTAHQQNDRAVWEAYGKAWNIGKESECVAYLMQLYQAMTAAEGGKK